jgi:ferredoxin
MEIKELKNFFHYLEQNGYTLIGPQKKEDRILIDKFSAQDFDLKALEKQPLFSFKKYLIPSEEILFFSKNSKFLPSQIKQTKLALFGMNVLDLMALALWRQVFEKDLYFQDRFKNTLIIGYGPAPIEENQFQIWQVQYEEDILEHIQFDIFIMKRGQKLEIYTGTRVGQTFLDKFGYQKYQHIQFTGLIKEEGVNPEMLEIKKKLEKMKPTDPLWQELGQKCIECGKCSVVCPTCFCFDFDDNISLDKIEKKRIWSSCFYQDFSQIAGGQKFLKTTAERIYFWYYHKFVRIPKEFSIPGCIACGRCAKVCPVNINIYQVLKRIKESN